jgi:hypothetical protein
LIPQTVRYLAHDGYYQRVKFVDGVVGLSLHSIGKLRCDSNLRYLIHGFQKSRACKRKYDRKVHFDDISRFELAAIQGNQKIYTAVVNGVSLKHNIRIAYIVKQNGKKISTVLLFSTDIHLPASEIYRYYKARFQIEFLLFDAKQFMGLLIARPDVSKHYISILMCR